MADVEMNKGVQILLERMSSNPNEFVPDIYGKYPPKWRDIILSVEMRIKGGKDYQDQLPFLNDKEIKALWEKLRSLHGELFTKQVMNTLLRDAEDGLDYSVDYSELVELLRLGNLSPAELSSLARQVAGASPKVKN
jgi:hypothetical protein